MIITKEIQWDMGHRISNHDSVCKNLHGHRYKAEIFVEGNLVTKKGSSKEGMVIDFGDIKKIALKRIHDVLDHGFMVWKNDKLLVDFFTSNKQFKHIIVPFVPTSENIAAWIFTTLDKYFKGEFKKGLKLHSIKLWETPTSSAICTRKDLENTK